MTVNSIEALVRVRERIHDRSARGFDDNEILRGLDDEVRKLYTILRTTGDSVELDTLSVVPSTLTLIEPNVHQWKIPAYVGDIKMIQLKQTDQPGYQVPRVAREQMDLGRGFFPTSERTVWHPGPSHTVEIRGPISPYQAMQVWFIRRLPPLVHGKQNAPSTNVIAPDLTAIFGDFKARDRAYQDTLIEVTASANPANVDQVREVTSFTSGQFQFAEAWPATVATGDIWAMVLPLPEEYHEYLVALVTMRFLRRQGADEEMALLEGELRLLQHEFEMGIARQTSGEPPRLHSSRWSGR